jgi:hypothetical protein
VLKSLADAFGLSAEALLEQAGLLDDAPAEGHASTTEAAIRSDPRLTDSQKDALLSVYRGFTQSER